MLVDFYCRERDKRKICHTCSSSGEMMGGGMLKTKCTSCNGEGYLEHEFNSTLPSKTKFDKRSKSYKDALAKIKESAPHLSNSQAQNILDNELNNLDKK